MFTVLVYDVVNNRRRARFHRQLKQYMLPTQKSVFEADLNAASLQKVMALIHEELDLETDSIRVYSACRSCRGLVRVLGTAAAIPDPNAPLIL